MSIAAAERYEQIRPGGRVHDEPLPLVIPRDLPEMEIQARWFAGEFGRSFHTTDGTAVEIVQPGVWNREAGPDFVNAAVSFNGASPQQGAIELDRDGRDWERHGHATNPDYRGVVLHVFWHNGNERFFTRTDEHRQVPQVLLSAATPLDTPPNPVPAARPGRCATPLRRCSDPCVAALLEAAAQFRLRRKATRLARLRDLHGPDEALFQALAETLGYKANRLPFTLIAQRFPLRLLRQRGTAADALLFGVAGFLEDTDLSRHTPVTRRYLRALWENWWPVRSEFQRLILDPQQWRMTGLRPANHPQRRLAALARLAEAWPRLRHAAAGCDLRRLTQFFADLRDPYWEHHATLNSRATSRRMALVGRTRVIDMLANVFLPAAIPEQPALWTEYLKLTAPAASQRVAVAALRLFGEESAGARWTRRVAHQQGLLQIYEDFCMHDASDCARCAFPLRVEAWSAGQPVL